MIDDLERSGWSLGIKEGDELIKEEEEGKMDEDEAEKAKMRLKRSEAMRLLRAKVLSNVREIYSKYVERLGVVCRVADFACVFM